MFIAILRHFKLRYKDKLTKAEQMNSKVIRTTGQRQKGNNPDKKKKKTYH